MPRYSFRRKKIEAAVRQWQIIIFCGIILLVVWALLYPFLTYVHQHIGAINLAIILIGAAIVVGIKLSYEEELSEAIERLERGKCVVCNEKLGNTRPGSPCPHCDTQQPTDLHRMMLEENDEL